MRKEPLHCYLVRLGGRFERASLKTPRDYQAMSAIEKELAAFYADPEVTFDPGMFFRRGRNLVRSKRGLEMVEAW